MPTAFYICLGAAAGLLAFVRAPLLWFEAKRRNRRDQLWLARMQGVSGFGGCIISLTGPNEAPFHIGGEVWWWVLVVFILAWAMFMAYGLSQCFATTTDKPTRPSPENKLFRL